VANIVEPEGPFCIIKTPTVAEEKPRVLKHDDMFAVFDRYGDIRPVGRTVQGLYNEGTRFLSRLELSLYGDKPMFLSSTVKEDNGLLAIDLTNPDMVRENQAVVPHGTLHLFRSIFLWQGSCFERLLLSNYGPSPLPVNVTYDFSADFADIFEVRGSQRPRKGRMAEPSLEPASVVLSYEGLDGVTRRTRLCWATQPETLSGSRANFRMLVPPRGEATIFLTISCELRGGPASPVSYEEALDQAERASRSALALDCQISTSNEQFNHWLSRSLHDLHLMITETPEGPYPYAGVPWFSTPFGRDGIITAMEFLWVNPDLAKGVLCYLASTQATKLLPESDAEPGKILHETRKGEMAALGEIPFGRYYGTVDATPLFIVLAGQYYERTGDLMTTRSLWPSIRLALEWIDAYGDIDGDGFVEYARTSSKGLVHQGWKDSYDSVSHADGSLAEGPIALCEVQGYVYEAKRRGAELAIVLGEESLARKLHAAADTVRQRFDEVFWCDDLGTYALALDGRKQPCRVKSSNAGHCLLAGIAPPGHARRTAETLTSEEFFSGWGIRTLATNEARFNPMSYHNGSIWPHDNALIAAGLARYGFRDHVLRIFAGMFDAALSFDLNRLPELFCGFARRPGEGPCRYPVASAPQAWATASLFLLLQSCLGISVRAVEGKVEFTSPCLPPFLDSVQIKNLRIGQAILDFSFNRDDEDAVVSVTRRKGPIEVLVRK